jgi:hypothetical protein
MRRLKPVYALAAILILPGLLPGCAVERKCGLNGCPGDAEIAANVQSMIDQQADVGPPNSVRVETLDHVVYLNGAVSEGNMSRTAEAIALKTLRISRPASTCDLRNRYDIQPLSSRRRSQHPLDGNHFVGNCRTDKKHRSGSRRVCRWIRLETGL